MPGPVSFRDLLPPHFMAGASSVQVGFVTVAALVIVTGLALATLARGRRLRRRPRVLAGKAFVTDGDGLLVQNRRVRFAGLDAPEWDQRALHGHGCWFKHGSRVKSAPINEIGGRPVQVRVESWDRFGRTVGTVTCEGRDIGEWLVSEGHAIAAHGDRYMASEAEARNARRGMWAHKHNIDPRRWRWGRKRK